MKKQVILTVVLVLAGIVQTNCQDRLINGTVNSSEDGGSIPGVSIVVKGTTIGTVSDFEGNFSLNFPDYSRNLCFTFIRMKTQEIEIGKQEQINVIMDTDVVGVDEITIIYDTLSQKSWSVIVTARQDTLIYY